MKTKLALFLLTSSLLLTSCGNTLKFYTNGQRASFKGLDFQFQGPSPSESTLKGFVIYVNLIVKSENSKEFDFVISDEPAFVRESDNSRYMLDFTDSKSESNDFYVSVVFHAVVPTSYLSDKYHLSFTYNNKVKVIYCLYKI